MSLQAAGAISKNTLIIRGTAALTVQNSLVNLSRPNSYLGRTTINSDTNTALTVTHASGADTSQFTIATGATHPGHQFAHRRRRHDCHGQ